MQSGDGGGSGRGSLTLRDLGSAAGEGDPFSMASLEPSPETEENSVIGRHGTRRAGSR